jgi:hypothetical protein
MTVTISKPSTREVEYARAIRALLKNHLLALFKDQLLAPDAMLQDLGTAIDQIPIYHLAEQAKMMVPVEETVRNWKWLEAAIEVAALYFKEYPDAIIGGASNSQIEGYYASMNLRDRLDAGPSEQLDRRCRELVSQGFLKRENQGGHVLYKPTKLLLERINS